jgi:hypothetical protein
MKIFKCFGILFLLFLHYELFAQSEKSTQLVTFYDYKNEVGVNTTALLSNLLSFTKDDGTTFGVYYARHIRKFTFRIGANVFTDSRSTFDTLGERVLRDQNHGVRLSFEKNIQLSNRFMMHAGIDLLGRYVSSYSTLGNFFSNSIENISAGGGPALRIVYKPHKRILLMTESILQGEYGNKIQTTVLNQSRTKNTNDFYSFKLMMPTNLFISIQF